jgi:heme-degrading monooxygenase HmoA
MIVRVWNARTSAENEPAYRAHLQEAVFPVLRSLKGFVSARLMERVRDDGVDIVVESTWSSMEAVRAFAGDALEQAVVAPAARAVLSSYDSTASHYEVKAECAP